MKIAVITNLYNEYSRGGAEVVAKEVVTGLQSRGHDVFIITSEPFLGFKSLKFRKQDNIYSYFPLNIFHYPNDYKYNIFIRMVWNIFDVFNFHSYFQLSKILQEEKPDIVLSHNLKGLGYLTPLAIKKNAIHHIHTLHDVQLDNPSGLIIHGKEDDWLSNFLGTKIYSAINKVFFKYIDTVISPSNFLMNYYTDKGFFKNSKKKILRNPVTVTATKTSEGKWTEMNFLYLGQIEDHKGVEFLIEVFSSYLSNIDNFLNHTLHIVGDGSKFDELKNKYGNFPGIGFYGKIPHKELAQIFVKMDFMIFPSLCYENSPTVITESLANGIPVLCSDIGGAGELIENGINGYKFSPKDGNELLELLNFCKDNLGISSKMKQNCMDSVASFTMDRYLDELEREFDNNPKT